ncbi:SigE family RNA polymerase sigma factor [Catelliglobosispora koreensis]|uniref:SigE family RNA polymerase sigma factor n=1 Tax=Catelliglobosispora koreensis TaxID=129052 RepID=UPI00038154ED|nr:SigE family RNA polymerase sigma factor [Catelliglobosispora koreensis]
MENFDDFVATRSHRLLHTAYLLTRDHALAEDLLQTALARSWAAWDRIEGDPEPYVRRVLVNTFRSWWRRRWNGEVPTGLIPERGYGPAQSDVDDRDLVLRALGRLPKRQRAVLVLRYFEDLSETQIAELMSVSAGAVRSYAAKGIASLRADPALLSQLPAPLTVPEGTQRLSGVRHRVAAARRRNVAVALVLALATVAALLVFRPQVDQSPPITPPSVVPSTADSFDSYQFPSPPSVLAPIVLDTYGMFDGAVAIFGPPVTVRWHARMKITVRSQTPGRYTVKLNGVPVRTVIFWDYTAPLKKEVFEAEPGLVGSDVTVTVEPERAHAHWVVAIGPAAPWEQPQPASSS